MPELMIRHISDKQIWNGYLKEFSDSNVYQTWNFPKIGQNLKNLEHISFFLDNNLIGLALVRIRILPLLNGGIASIFRGPVWQRKDHTNNIESLYLILEAIKKEYSENRKLLLRIRPFIFRDSVFAKQFKTPVDFKLKGVNKAYRTIILDINEDLLYIKDNFRKQWRQVLNRSLKNGLTIIAGTSTSLYKTFTDVYYQMHKRKRFKQYVSVEKFGDVNKELEDDFKSNIFIALKDNLPIGSFLGSSIGQTGIALLGGVNEVGMKYGAAYVLQWEMIKWLKEQKCTRYDLGGIDPVNNYGGYIWKTGISKNEVRELGILEVCGSNLSKTIVSIGEQMRKLR